MTGVFLLTIFTSVNLILLICQNKHLIQSLLDGSDAAGILTSDYVYNLLRKTKVFFLNNLLIVTFEFFAPGALDFGLPVKIVLAVLGIGSIVLGVFLSARKERERTEGNRLAFFWRAFAGIAICVVMWIAQLVVSRG